MNLIEHYIIEVLEELPYSFTEEEYNQFPCLRENEYVEIRAKTDCYGHIVIIERIMTKDEWTMTKQRGYFMG